jgi:1-phosphatidylinositol phosphodiesterase
MRLVSSVGFAVMGVALATLAGSCIVQPPPGYVASGASTLEINTDRPGGDYRNFDLASPHPEECRDTCGMEPQCLAYTYVNPGVQSPNARCWLKNTVPPPNANTCCISGVKNVPPPPTAYTPPPEAAPPPAMGAPPAAPAEAPPPAPPPVSAAPPPGYEGTPPPRWVGEPAGPGMEVGINRRGSDYANFDLPQPRPHLCEEACMRDGRCRAYTYVNPGVQGPNARCWLKDQVPPPDRDGCCTSGVKENRYGAPVASGPFEVNMDRPGFDYRNFDLPQPRPEMCREFCMREGPCRAFTYVKPGVQAPGARCWLKTGVPRATPSDCCISGVK